LEGVAGAVNFVNFAELLIHFDNWLGLILISLEAGQNDFFGIVGSA